MFSSGGPSVRFLTRYDGEVSEPLVGRQGKYDPIRVTQHNNFAVVGKVLNRTGFDYKG